MNRGLKASQLRYARHNNVLFQGLELELKPGQGLLVSGPNGSGKTSLLRILAGLVSPTSGSLSWQGQDLEQDRLAYHQDLHFLGHGQGFKNKLSLQENLALSQNLAGRVCQAPVIEEALRKLGLHEHKDKMAEQLSAGQKRRLALARLLISPKPLWILDEPFTNLDAQGQHWFCHLLEKHLQDGGLVILASHQALNLQNAALFQQLSLPQRKLGGTRHV